MRGVPNAQLFILRPPLILRSVARKLEDATPQVSKLTLTLCGLFLSAFASQKNDKTLLSIGERRSLSAFRKVVFVWAILHSGFVSAEELGATAAAPIIAIDQTVSPEEADLRRDLGFFCDDSLSGRDVGSSGIDQAADYIAASFEKSGLRVDSFAGSPKQSFTVPISVSLGSADENSLRFTRNEQAILGELDRTFRPMAIGDSGKADAELVFAGFGITAPEFGYDDYAKIDARGRVVVIIRKEPVGAAFEGRFNGEKNSQHAYFETKIANAEAHGAIGVLLVNDKTSIQERSSQVVARIAEETQRLNKVTKQLTELPEEAVNTRETLRLRRDTIAKMLEDMGRQQIVAEEGLMEIGEAGEKPIAKGVPVVSISRDLANQILNAADWDSVDATRGRIERTGLPSSTTLVHRVNLQTSLNPAVVKACNVVGVLPGKGALANQSVIVGAHYDHVGLGGPASLAPGTIAIHNGADDNASGTSALLASVNRIQNRLVNSSSHRRVLFIAFTAEERGLLGSEYYVRHPRYPLETTAAMINLDMVGRLRDNDLTVYGTGSATEMDSILEAANQATGFKLFKVASGFGPSDHQSFYTRNIPVLFFFTGLHNDYHRPSDDFDKINFNGLTRITDITSGVVAELATRLDRPHYAATDRDVEIRWQATAYLGVQLRDMNDNDGILVTGVSPQGAAEKAGILVGDRLKKFDESEIRTIGDVLKAVRLREANDPLRVDLTRGSEALTLIAILQNRPGQ